jgi:hypothetical protein
MPLLFFLLLNAFDATIVVGSSHRFGKHPAASSNFELSKFLRTRHGEIKNTYVQVLTIPWY